MKKTSIFLVAMIAIGCISCGNNREPSQNDSTLSSSSSHSHRIITHEGKEPTCLEEGYETYYTCETCDYSTYERIPALGHKYEKKIIIENGETTVRYICSRCGDVYEENCKIELADGFDIDYGTKQYPTISKMVSNSETSIALSSAIIVSKECTWTLSKDIEGKDIIKTKNMSLNTGHNYAYITVWFANEEYNTVYYVDIYRLNMFTYTIKNDNNIIKRETVEENTLIDEPSTQNKKGYSFVTWQDDKNQSITFPYAIKRNVIISAKWQVNQYKITFDTDGGSEISQLKLDYQESISVENPTKEGYTFIGWEPELPSTMPANDISVRAKWSINQYTITFDTLGGNNISSITQDYNTKIEKPNDPIKEGHTFMGWNPEIPDVMPATNMVITAKWDVNTYTITFDTDGGTEEESIVQEFGSTIIVPNNSKKEGSILLGWKDKDGNIYEINDTFILERSMHLKAIWINKDFEFSRNGDGTITIAKYTGSDEEVVIPNSVTSIRNSAFSGCTSLASIVIPDSVTSIGSYAFYGCTSLTNIVIPSSVTSIGDSAFEGCTSLTSIEIPSSVTSIGDWAFSGCTSLAICCEAESKPSGWKDGWNSSNCPVVWNVLKIGDYNGLSYLVCSKDGNQYITITGYDQSNTKVEIPESIDGISVTTINERAFKDCTSLTNIVIPSSVTSIGKGGFEGCSSLESMTLPYIGESADRNQYLGYIFGASSFSSNDTYVPTSLKEVIILDTCTSIGDSAFRGCTSLASILIPSSVTSIGDSAFEVCTSLTSIEIPSSVTSIGNFAFEVCTSLTSIEIPSSVTSIGDSAFRGCTSLASILIPSSVTSIGSYAFSDCTSLTSIVIPSSVTSIGDSAFFGCTSLTSIVIPSSVTSIGSYAFYGCTSLTNIVIPSSVTSIGRFAFYGCTSLTNIVIPSSVTSIGDSAFEGCTSLTSIEIPDSVTSIGSRAFYGCTSLTSIVIPSSVTSIGSYAFYGCTSLTIYCEAESKPSGWISGWNSSNCPVVWNYKK